MELKISKAQMELANKLHERMAAKLDKYALFRGVPATEFDKEHLVMLCTVFAEEWHKAKKMNESLLKSKFVGEINRAYVEHTLLNQFIDEAGLSPIEHKEVQTIWRKICNKIREWA